MDMLKFLIFIYLDHLCLPGLLQTLLMGCWWATFFVMPTDEWATITVESTDGIPSQSSLLTGYLHCRAYIWATYTVHTVQCTAYWKATFTVQTPDGLTSLSSQLMGIGQPSQSSLLMGYLVEPTDRIPSLSNLLMNYLLGRACRRTTISVEPTDLLMAYIPCRAFRWATYTVEPTDLMMGYPFWRAYIWATFTDQPTDILMGYLLCWAY